MQRAAGTCTQCPHTQRCPVSCPWVQQSSRALAGQCQPGRGLQAEGGSGSSLSQPQLSAKNFPEGKSPTPHVPRRSWRSPACISFTKPWLGHPICKRNLSSPALHSPGRAAARGPHSPFPRLCPRMRRGRERAPGLQLPDLPGFPSLWHRGDVMPCIRLSSRCPWRGSPSTAGAKCPAPMGSDKGAAGCLGLSLFLKIPICRK